MDIAALSMSMAQTNLMSQVSTAVLSKTMDTAETQGDNVVKMMEQSVTPGVGANLDVSV